MEAVSKFIAQAHDQMKKAEEYIKSWDNIPPLEQMTMQEFAEYFPDQALDPLNRPTIWPHTPEWQLTEEDEEEWRNKLAGKAHH